MSSDSGRKIEFWDLMHAITCNESASTLVPEGIDVNFRSFIDYILDKEPDTR